LFLKKLSFVKSLPRKFDISLNETLEVADKINSEASFENFQIELVQKVSEFVTQKMVAKLTKVIENKETKAAEKAVKNLISEKEVETI
jgi:hypothetical protein